jgi:hypothetical protein
MKPIRTMRRAPLAALVATLGLGALSPAAMGAPAKHSHAMKHHNHAMKHHGKHSKRGPAMHH